MIQGIEGIKIKGEHQNGFIKSRRRKPQQPGEDRPKIINIVYIDTNGSQKKAGRQNKGSEYHEHEPVESQIDERQAGKKEHTGDDDHFECVYENAHTKRG
jgi:hypothetical protein